MALNPPTPQALMAASEPPARMAFALPKRIWLKASAKALLEEAQALVGEHDFTSFASIKSQTNTFVRTIHSISVKRDERDVITIRVEGNGFLYNQVRIIAGSLILVGSGQRERGFIKEALEKKDREAAGPTAPPEGLTLIRIDYGR